MEWLTELVYGSEEKVGASKEQVDNIVVDDIDLPGYSHHQTESLADSQNKVLLDDGCFCLPDFDAIEHYLYLGLGLVVVLLGLVVFIVWRRNKSPPPQKLSRATANQQKRQASQSCTERRCRDLEKENGELKEKLAEKEDEKKEMEEKLNERDKSIDTLRIDNRQNAEKITNLEKQLENQRKKAEKAKGQMEAENNNVITELKNKLAEKNQQIENLTDKVSEAEQNVNNAKFASIKPVVSSTPSMGGPEEMKAKVTELQNAVDILQQQYKEQAELIAKLRKEIVRLEHTLEDKNAELKKEEKKVKELEEEKNNLKEEIGTLLERIKKLTDKNKALEEDLAETKRKLEKTEKERDAETKRANRLQTKNEELQKSLYSEIAKRDKVREWATKHMPCSVTLPLTAHSDDRVTPLIPTFLHYINAALPGSCSSSRWLPEEGLSLDPVHGSDIDRNHRNPVILPVISASRSGSDMSAALNKAKIACAKVILVLFHHKPPYNCRIAVPTEKRLTDKAILDQCVGVVDAAFWQGDMYDCSINQQVGRKVMELLKWNVKMEDFGELLDNVQD